MDNYSLGSTLKALANHPKKEGWAEDKELAQAAKVAMDKFDEGYTKGSWVKSTTFSQKGKSFTSKVGYLLVMIRVLDLVDFYELMTGNVDENQLEEIIEFVDEFIPNHRSMNSPKASLIFECVLIPATRIDAPPHHQVMARNIFLYHGKCTG